MIHACILTLLGANPVARAWPLSYGRLAKKGINFEDRSRILRQPMRPARSIVLFFVVAAPSLAASQTMSFERAMEILKESCGADIDDNCRGINFDPTRLNECLRRNRISSKCEANYPRIFSAIEERASARVNLLKSCNWEMNHLCGQVRQDPIKGLQCLLESSKKATPNCNKAIDTAGYR